MSDEKTTEDRVAEYLVRSGLPLEMRVAGVFRRTMHSVQQSGSVEQRVTYLTPDQSQGSKFVVRETDVVVAARKLVTPNVTFQVRLVIECKGSGPKTQPWVLFRSLNPALGGVGVSDPGVWMHWAIQRHGSGARPPKFERLSNVFERDLLNTRRIFCASVESTDAPDRQGDTRNRARDAVRQVLSAAAAITGTDQQRVADADGLGVTVPVVVTTVDMFAVTGSDDGSYEVHPTHRELVYNQFDIRGAAPVWVVNEIGLEELAKEFLELQALATYNDNGVGA